MNDTPLHRLAAFYESLAPDTVGDLDRLYTPDALFKDPFNEVRGTAAIARIFLHMFAVLEAPRFTVEQMFSDGQEPPAEAFLAWRFDFRRSGHAFTIRGSTHIRFDARGRVCAHRDYWDTAEELYAKLPLLGPVVRWLTRRLGTPA